MSTPKKLSLFVIVASVLLLVLAACGEAATPTPTATTASTDGGPAATATPTAIPTPTARPTGEVPQYGGIYRKNCCNTAHTDPWHVLQSGSDIGYQLGQEFNRLIEHKKPHVFGEPTDLVPALATEWSVDATETKWTFKLREGVTWHDGEQFDAHDVQATFERALDTDLLLSQYGVTTRAIIVGIEVVDDSTIIFDTGTPNALTIPWMSNWSFPIVPDHLIRDSNPGPDDTGWLWMQPRKVDPDFGKGTGTLGIGTGPFIMTNFESDALLTTKRNPNYWAFDEHGQRLPYLDGIIDFFTVDRTRALAEFATAVSNDLWQAYGLSDTKAELLCARRQDPCHVDLAEHGFFYVKLNDHIPPFDDPQMREVARWALNVRKTAFLPMGVVGNHGEWNHFAFPEATLSREELYTTAPWLDPERELIPPDTWQLKAKERLAELGFPDGVDLEFPWYVSTTPIFRDMAGMMTTDAQAAGIKFSTAPSGGTNELQRAGKWNIGNSSCSSPLVDPSGAYAMGGLSFSSSVGRRPWNWDGVAEADRQFNAANQRLDPIARGEMFKDLERWELDPTRPFFAQVWTLQNMSVPDCVKGFTIGPGGMGSMEHVYTWLTDEGQCKKHHEDDLRTIEPSDLNVMQTVMWNWQ